MSLKFETVYRKSKKSVTLKELTHSDIETCHLNEFCELIGASAINWRWNLTQEVHLNKTKTFKNLLRDIYCGTY